MNPGKIWWEQIGNSLRLLLRITNDLRDYRSIVLQDAAELPWREDFYMAVDESRAPFSGGRRLKRLAWRTHKDPGEFVMEELCSTSVRAEYWPGQTRATYLATKSGLALNDYFVWVTGICNKDDLSRWIDFISQYEQNAKMMDQYAVFVLEYDGPPVETKTADMIACCVENYDCRVFCLEMAAALNNTELPRYQAELALSIGNGKPEFCAALLEKGESMLCDPITTAREVIKNQRNSKNDHFPEQSESAISSAVWQATVVLLFPVLERRRLNFITKYGVELLRYLPINNNNGDRIDEPCDLEIGPLYYIVTHSDGNFRRTEVDELRICRNARNLLAHNRLVPYSDVKSILLM